MGIGGLTRQNVRHALAFVWQGRNPAAAVYDSVGERFFLSPAPGWLNLGLWEGLGDEAEAPEAVRRLVRTLAEDLPAGGVVLDVGNGLGAQDPVIAETVRPARLIALNITESQLRAGRERLAAAGARAVAGDATRIPLRSGSVDGLICVEAAFHFRSRIAFFVEARRVLRPGGVLVMSDVPAKRMPRTPAELVAGVAQLRLWGLRPSAAATADRIAGQVRSAGFVDVRTESCGERVIDPALRLAHLRLAEPPTGVPAVQVLAARFFLAQAELLRRRGLIDYLLLRARVPGGSDEG
ncbi:MAG TPA: class I SAM-dependent methyltransferase [Actinomycetota bacterium]|jgi:ubiquinone/menaquinone biosynthesis C-methylase UbiE